MHRHGESHPHHLHGHPHRGHHRHHGDRRSEGRRSGAFRRRFFSRDERIAGLEAYLNDLRAEAQAVEEKLTRLKVTD